MIGRIGRMFGFGVPAMGPQAGFGAGYNINAGQMPFTGQGRGLGEMSQEDLDEEMRRIRELQAMQQSQIQAPKDRGMFGRFAGFNPFRFDPDKGVGEGNRLYAIGAGLAGMGTGDPGLTASLLEPKLKANRERVAARDEEARRQAMLQQLGQMPGVTDQQRALLGMGLGVDQLAERAFAPPEQAEYGLDLVPVRDPETGRTIYVQASKAGGYRPVEGIEPLPETSDENWTKITLEDGEYEYVLGKPDTLRKIGPSPAKTPLVDFGGFGMDYGSIPQAMARVKDPESPTGSRLVSEPGVPSKPLIGSESMGRVAAGLPNMRKAVSDLYSLFGTGYTPGQDWGALALEMLPGIGDVAARLAGGQDYQTFDLAYSQFEAAALPIMSGAAVTESEAKRALRALRVRIGDSQETINAKMANMSRMVQGLEAAAAGDTEALRQIVGGIASQEGQGAAPMQGEMEDNGLPPGFVIIE